MIPFHQAVCYDLARGRTDSLFQIIFQTKRLCFIIVPQSAAYNLLSVWGGRKYLQKDH
jgi:hypothetical protein